MTTPRPAPRRTAADRHADRSAPCAARAFAVARASSPRRRHGCGRGSSGGDAIQTRIAELESEVEADEQHGAESASPSRSARASVEDRHRPARGRGVDARDRHVHRRNATNWTSVNSRRWRRSRRSNPNSSRTSPTRPDSGGARGGRRGARRRGGRHRPPGRDAHGRTSGRRVAVDPGRRHRPATTAARPQLGVVVSRLEGKQCTGCHLDLSAAEIDTARTDAAETGFTDCPQCGRILVIAPTDLVIVRLVGDH